MGHRDKTFATVGERLIDEMNCLSCHKIEGYSAGPSYNKVAERYPSDSPIKVSYLAGRIINGGSGVWGEKAMPAHPNLSEKNAKAIVNYILSLNNPPSQNGLDPSGNFVFKDHLETKKEGRYVIKSSYLDKGGEFVGPLKTSTQLYLRYHQITAPNTDFKKKTQRLRLNAELFPKVTERHRVTEVHSGGHLGFNKIDLSEIKTINIEFYTKYSKQPEGTMEIKADGQVIGKDLLGNYRNNNNGGYSLQIPIEDIKDFARLSFHYQGVNDNDNIVIHRFDFLNNENVQQPLSMK